MLQGFLDRMQAGTLAMGTAGWRGHGDFLIQVSRAEYQLFFREVDRMHYCGMMGKLNGSMTVTRGAKRQCSVEGIMDRNDTEALHHASDTESAHRVSFGSCEPEE